MSNALPTMRYHTYTALGVLSGPSLGLLWNYDALHAYLSHVGPWKAVVFITAHIMAAAIGIPGTVLVIAGGAVFGLVWGTIWSVIGATLGATAAFCLARHLLHDWCQRRFCHHPHFQRLNHLVHRQGLSCVLAIRFAPISPFNVMNFLLGLTQVQLRPYALGTLLGIIPGTMAYTWLGVTGIAALHGGSKLPLILCMGCLTLLSVLPLLAKQRV